MTSIRSLTVQYEPTSNSIFTKSSFYSIVLSVIQAVIVTGLIICITVDCIHISSAFGFMDGIRPEFLHASVVSMMAMWFIVGYSIDSFLIKNSMQTIYIPIFHAYMACVFIIQDAIFDEIKSCITGIGELLADEVSAFVSNGTSLANPAFESQVSTLTYSNKCTFVSATHSLREYRELDIGASNSSFQVLMETLEDSRGSLDKISQMYTAVACIVAFCLLINAFLSFQAFKDIGWTIYRVQGADIKKRTILRHYHLFMSLLRAEMFFGYCILVAIVAKTSYTYNHNPFHSVFIISSVVFCIASFAFFFLGRYAIRNNNRICQTIFTIFLFALIAFSVLLLIHSSWQTSQLWNILFELSFISISAPLLWVTFLLAYYDVNNGLLELVELMEMSSGLFGKNVPIKERMVIE